jgi:hypothetical protein
MSNRTGSRARFGETFWRISMSRSGQTRKSALATAMSAFFPIATKLRTSLEVRFVPTRDSCTVPKSGGVPLSRRKRRIVLAYPYSEWYSPWWLPL